jgi:hypothetical protein
MTDDHSFRKLEHTIAAKLHSILAVPELISFVVVDEKVADVNDSAGAQHSEYFRE